MIPKLTSDDCVSLMRQAQRAGEYFADMIEDSGERDTYRLTTDEVDGMLDGHILYLADDRTEVDWRKVPPVLRAAMKYIAWKAEHEHLAPRRGGKARKAKRPRGSALIAAATAYRDALKG